LLVTKFYLVMLAHYALLGKEDEAKLDKNDVFTPSIKRSKDALRNKVHPTFARLRVDVMSGKLQPR
jgi:hypothetical protein